MPLTCSARVSVPARYGARCAVSLARTIVVVSQKTGANSRVMGYFLAHGGAEFAPLCGGGVAGLAAATPERDVRGP